MRRAAMRLARDLWRAARNFRRDGCLELAAAVSFYSLLSLGPLVHVAGVVLGRLLGGTSALDALLNEIEPFLPAEVAAALPAFARRDLRLGEGLVWLTLPALAWVASSGFYVFEGAIHAAFGTSGARHRLRSRLVAFAVLAGVLLIVAGTLVIDTALPRVAELRRALGGDGSTRWPGLLVRAILIAASGVALLLFYRLIPRGRVRWRAAAAGALLALPLWELGRRFFGALMLASPAFGLLSGTLAAVVVFLLWIYASVAVVLVGAEFAAVRDGRRGGSGGTAPRA